MTDYAQALNRDSNLIKTAADYFSADAKWVNTVTTAQRDAVARAYERIIDIIGMENIKLFLPMWEATGTTFKDLLRPDLTFTVSGATLAQTGLLHPVPSFDGVNDYAIQDPIIDAYARTDNSQKALNAPGDVAVQKMKVFTGKVKFAQLKLIKVGAPDGSLRVEIRTTKDGAAITNGTSALRACSTITTSAIWHGFIFTTPPLLQKNTVYYLALVYVGNTNADGSTVVKWQLDTAGGYGQGRHYYDSVTGPAWDDQAGQDHCFEVYSDDLDPGSNDYSIIAVVKSTVASIANQVILSQNSPTVTNSLYMSMQSTGAMNHAGHDGSARTATTYRYPLNVSTVSAMTFSYANALNKVRAYLNGANTANADGTAATAQTAYSSPLQIGYFISGAGVGSSYFKGLIGPIIKTKTELTPAQMGAVTNQLLALRRLQEAV